MLIVAGTITIDSSKRSVMEAAFDRMREATLKEPGCIEYQAYLDRKDPGTILIFEKWETEEALRAHFATPHMAEFGSALGQAGVQGSSVKKYVVASEGPVM
jgi:quinol monooxygenase YgiN